MRFFSKKTGFFSETAKDSKFAVEFVSNPENIFSALVRLEFLKLEKLEKYEKGVFLSKKNFKKYFLTKMGRREICWW